MTPQHAHQILEEAKAGIGHAAHLITRALIATGDISAEERTYQCPIEITHAVPTFSPEEPRPEKDTEKMAQYHRPAKEYLDRLPQIVHKPFALSS